MADCGDWVRFSDCVNYSFLGIFPEGAKYPGLPVRYQNSGKIFRLGKDSYLRRQARLAQVSGLKSWKIKS